MARLTAVVGRGSNWKKKEEDSNGGKSDGEADAAVGNWDKNDGEKGHVERHEPQVEESARCDDDAAGIVGDDEKKDVVYRIRSRTTTQKMDAANNFILTDGLGTRLINDFLRWTFRAAFFQVFLAGYAAWLVLVVAFAAVVYAIGRAKPECIAAGDSDFLWAGTQFMDAVQLSWTTLSTVGYGIVAPNVNNEDGHLRCIGVKFLMAFEGTLFSAFLLYLV